MKNSKSQNQTSNEIQRSQVLLDIDNIPESEYDFKTDKLNYESPYWETFLNLESAEEALRELINLVNNDGLNDVDYYYRAVNHQEKKVL